jgi:hypothetical protein
MRDYLADTYLAQLLSGDGVHDPLLAAVLAAEGPALLALGGHVDFFLGHIDAIFQVG